MSQAYCHILYKGSVQGVGFRFTASRMAVSLGLTGFVRNISGGDVEVALEGEKPVIQECIKGINDYMKGYVSDSEITWGDFNGRFNQFQVRF